MKKRIVAALLLVAMVFGLVACGGSNDAPAANNDPAVNKEPQTVVADDGTVVLHMDKDTLKRWNFAFHIVSRQDGLVINELANDNGVVLRYELPKRRSQGGNPVAVGSGGVNPRYQFPAEEL